MKCKLYATLTLLMITTGCTPEGIRVTEYTGGGRYPVFGGGDVQGCQIVQGKKIQGCFKYEGDRCFYDSCVE